MKKRFTTYILIALTLVPSLGHTQASRSDIEAGLDQTVLEFTKAFPIVELYVTAIQNGKIVLEQNQETALYPGLELSAFRGGKAFTHPITGVTLGYFEETLGHVRITEVKESYSLAEPLQIEAGKEIKRGDKVRITARKIKLAVWKISNQSKETIDKKVLNQKLLYKLEASERFEVISPNKFSFALDKLSVDQNAETLTQDQLQQLARTLGIQALIKAQIKKEENVNWLESQLISTISTHVLVKTKARLQGMLK